MIAGIVGIGMGLGLVGVVLALMAGLGPLMALLAYSGGGMAGMVAGAVMAACAAGPAGACRTVG